MENMSTASENQSQQVNGLPIKQVVVAVNLSACSEKTVAYAIAIARSFGARIHLVYVQAPESITESTTEGVHKYLGEKRHDRVQELTDLFKRTRRSYPNCGADLESALAPLRSLGWLVLWMLTLSSRQAITRLS
jgi:Universal stress protein family